MKKYLFYIHALSGGGAERVWSVLASALAEEGHDVTLAVDAAASDNLSYLSPAVRVHVLGGSHLQTIWRLSRLMRAYRPDAAISALAAANVKLTAAALLANRLGNTVLSYHGYAESEPQRLSQIGFVAAPLLTRMTARTICVSDGLLGYMRRRWGANAARTSRLYNPVATVGAPANVTTDELAARPPLVVAAGRLVPYKNFVGLVQAFAAVPIPDARLVIYGEGVERDAIEREIARLGLQTRVDLPGYAQDLGAAMAKARCFVMPSHSESFGLVVVEALAQGLPVVATDCDGPVEILAEPGLGTIVPRGDMAALGAALTQCLRNPGSSAPRMARAKDFSVSVAVAGYDRLLSDVAGKSQQRRPIGKFGAARFTDQ